jgi:hypothetical protein
VLLVVMAAAVIVPAAAGFFAKFVQFLRALQSDEAGRFAIVPILNYLAVAAGFVCLLVWAVLRGMFRDIERPKYTMLENEDRLDRAERIGDEG